MRKRILSVLSAASVLATMAVATGPQADAMAKIKCKQTTGTAHVDPIVHHNEMPGGMVHLHQFFGNNTFLSMKNPNQAAAATLRTGGTNCENSADTAGYWTPVLTDKATGAPIPVQAFTAYYRSFDGQETGEAQAFPADTRLVATKHDWSCGQFSGTGPSQTIPDCTGQSGKPGHTLTGKVYFPSCWDGIKPSHKTTDMGDTRDNAHYAYPAKSRGTSSCPTGFPVKMVELRETVQFTYVGSPSNVVLVSDAMMGGSGGSSFHGDFLDAWQPGGLERVVADCIAPTGHPTAATCG